MIAVDGVVKRFGAVRAVDRVSFSVGAGEVVALLGPNGSGKTTTLKMIAGLVRPDAGRITVGDPPGSPWDPGARRALSFLPQRVAFPETLTGREVVEFYRAMRKEPAARAEAVLKFASLNGAGARAVGTYSGGMVQRLGLAVATLSEEATLLLDEPTAALDPEGLCAFYGLINDRRRRGSAILFTSHHVNDIDLADRVVIMARGQLAGEFDRERLRAWRDAHGVMRVRTAAGEITIKGSAQERAAALAALQSKGSIITGLTAEDGRVEVLYAQLIAALDAPPTV